MEYTRDSYKYTVTLTAPTITIDAIDCASLCDYRVVIDPAQYRNVKTPEHLYTMLIDGFEGKRVECKLTLTRDSSVDIIRLELDVTVFTVNIHIVETLRPVITLSHQPLVDDEIDKLNQVIERQQEYIDVLKNELDEIFKLVVIVALTAFALVLTYG